MAQRLLHEGRDYVPRESNLPLLSAHSLSLHRKSARAERVRVEGPCGKSILTSLAVDFRVGRMVLRDRSPSSSHFFAISASSSQEKRREKEVSRRSLAGDNAGPDLDDDEAPNYRAQSSRQPACIFKRSQWPFIIALSLAAPTRERKEEKSVDLSGSPEAAEASFKEWLQSVDGKEVLSQTFDADVDSLFKHLFSASPFFMRFHQMRKSFSEKNLLLLCRPVTLAGRDAWYSSLLAQFKSSALPNSLMKRSLSEAVGTSMTTTWARHLQWSMSIVALCFLISFRVYLSNFLRSSSFSSCERGFRLLLLTKIGSALSSFFFVV